MKSFLLICYSYPPYPGTGGRRWAKLSKYLAMAGNKIYVINSVNKHSNSIWEKDTIHPNIKLYSFENKYEHIINNITIPLIQKIISKVFFILSKIKTNANYSDQSLWWNDNAYAKAKEIIKENKIDYLLISCPPYHIMDKFSGLKKEFPQIKLILDYRDIWTISQKGKGFFSHLSDKRFSQEALKETNALLQADYVFTVADEMTHAIKERFKNKKVITVHNGFDEEDIDENFIPDNNSPYLQPGKLNMLFAGSLVTDSNTYAIPFFNALLKLKIEKPELYLKLNLCIFGNVNSEIATMISEHGLNCVTFFSPVSSKAIGKIYKEFDFLLLFLIPYYTYAFISKFFDYLPARKPIICISEKGSFSKYLEGNDLGKNIEPENIYVNLVNILSFNTKIKINTSFDISKFNYQRLAQKIVETITYN